MQQTNLKPAFSLSSMCSPPPLPKPDQSAHMEKAGLMHALLENQTVQTFAKKTLLSVQETEKILKS